MKPFLFRPKDLSIMWIPLVMVSLVIGAFVWNYTSPEGEAIPWPGWLVSGLMVTASLGIVGAFYWQRNEWLKLYGYTIGGVDFFYDPKAVRYLVVDIEPVMVKLLKRWANHLALPDGPERAAFMQGSKLQGVICLFRPEGHWDQAEQGYWHRQVTGLAWDSAVMVGQGGKSVEQTAMTHEISHIMLNRTKGYTEEAEAHRIFTVVGVG